MPERPTEMLSWCGDELGHKVSVRRPNTGGDCLVPRRLTEKPARGDATNRSANASQKGVKVARCQEDLHRRVPGVLVS